MLSSDLFTKSAKFTLKPYGQFPLQWSWPNGLPEGTKPPADETHAVGHNIRMEAQNIPAFLVYGVVGLVLAIVATIPALLGWLILGPVTIASAYTGYRDIFTEPIV